MRREAMSNKAYSPFANPMTDHNEIVILGLISRVYRAYAHEQVTYAEVQRRTSELQEQRLSEGGTQDCNPGDGAPSPPPSESARHEAGA